MTTQKKNAKKSDGLKPNLVLADLAAETKKQEIEPFVIDLGDGESVEFTDIYAWDYERAEELAFRAQAGLDRPSETLKEWLGEKQFKRLASKGVDARAMNAILEAVFEHFNGVYKPGEGGASAS